MVFKFKLSYTYFQKFYGMLGISRLLFCNEKNCQTSSELLLLSKVSALQGLCGRYFIFKQ